MVAPPSKATAVAILLLGHWERPMSLKVLGHFGQLKQLKAAHSAKVGCLGLRPWLSSQGCTERDAPIPYSLFLLC